MSFTLERHGITLAGIQTRKEAARLQGQGWKIIRESESPPEETPEEEPVAEAVEISSDVEKVMEKLNISDPDMLRDTPDEDILGLYGVGPATLEAVRENFQKRGEQ